MGLTLIIGAFVCVLVVFYFLVNAHRQRLAEIETLEEKFLALDTEKNAMQRKVADLQDEVGRSIDMNKLLDTAGDRYSAEEKDRKEGYLWIDRQTSTVIVTLGALHGLSAGKKLAVYDQNKKPIGDVIVDTPLDVISYVHPMAKSIADFRENYYRVAIE